MIQLNSTTIYHAIENNFEKFHFQSLPIDYDDDDDDDIHTMIVVSIEFNSICYATKCHQTSFHTY